MHVWWKYIVQPKLIDATRKSRNMYCKNIFEHEASTLVILDHLQFSGMYYKGDSMNFSPWLRLHTSLRYLINEWCLQFTLRLKTCVT